MQTEEINQLKNEIEIILSDNKAEKISTIDLRDKTLIAGTLPRADQRDILFLKKNNFLKIKLSNKISILSSSPRRVYNLEEFSKNYLPFKLKEIKFVNIRGNIPTRFKKFIEGPEDSFVLAKAALDRLLNNNLEEFKLLADLIKNYIAKCLWKPIFPPSGVCIGQIIPHCVPCNNRGATIFAPSALIFKFIFLNWALVPQ